MHSALLSKRALTPKLDIDWSDKSTIFSRSNYHHGTDRCSSALPRSERGRVPPSKQSTLRDSYPSKARDESPEACVPQSEYNTGS